MSPGGFYEDPRPTTPGSSWSPTQAMVLDIDPFTTNVPASSDSRVSLEAPAGFDCYDMESSAAFPSESSRQQGSGKKRVSSQKRRMSQGHIPRPRNAFFLFRAEFIKERHIPGSAETNHNSLSKIIGNHWRSLTPEQKHVWEVKAKQEKAEHKVKYPGYRFRPVHNKHKKIQASVTHSALSAVAKSQAKRTQAKKFEDERRWEEVNQLLSQGKKGDELVRAVEELDRAREQQRRPQLQSDAGFHARRRYFASAPASRDSTPPQADSLQHFSFESPMGVGAAPRHRRSSSAPQPSGPLTYPVMRPIALPTLSPVISRPTSPSEIPSISRFRQGPTEGSNSSYRPNQGRLMAPFTQDHRLHSSAPHLGRFAPEPVPLAYLNPGLGMDQASLGVGHHHRFASSQLHSSPPVLRRSCTTPASLPDSSTHMPTLDGFPYQQPLGNSTEVIRPSFDGFPFDSHSHSDVMDLLQAPDQTNSYNSSAFAPSDAIAAEHVAVNGTINPASLMRRPGSSAPRPSPLETSMFSLAQPSVYSSEPSSATSAGSTPMMIPSSPFLSPAPSATSTASSFDGIDGDIDIAALLDVNCMHLGDLYPDNCGVSGMPSPLQESFGMGEDGAFYGFNGESDTISPLRLEEDEAFSSKMLDMPTPTQTTFGMMSS